MMKEFKGATNKWGGSMRVDCSTAIVNITDLFEATCHLNAASIKSPVTFFIEVEKISKVYEPE